MNQTAYDDRFFSAIKQIFEERIPFNTILGISLLSLNNGCPALGFSMKDELIGNYIRSTLHGGVISSVIDTTGGLTAFLGLMERMRDKSLEDKLNRFRNLGTIDLRVDYLRPGIGTSFRSTGSVMRIGSRVAVTRIELVNEKNSLLAVGTGACTIS